MANLNTLLCFLGLLCNVNGDLNKYDNYTLLKITPYNEQQMEALATFPDMATDPAEMEILRWSHEPNDTTDVLVSPSNVDKLEDFARRNGMPVEFKHHYGRTFTDSMEAQVSRGGFDHFSYHSYDDIISYLKKVRDDMPLVRLEEVGKSYEKRPIYLVKISTRPNAKNPIIFIEGGMHAREWVSPAMVLYLIHRLTTDGDEEGSKELIGVDWYIMPVVNPDGYEYTRSHRQNRLWRKTRSKTPKNRCIGVDLNRNFGYEWGFTGVSTDPCSEVFRGATAFSEVEARIIRDVTAKEKARIKLYVSVHTYGNYLIYPWGYTKKLRADKWRRLHNLALKASDELRKAGGRPLRVMSAAQWYPAAGISSDYAFGGTGVPYAYTLELTGGFEFTYPSSILHVQLPQYYEVFVAMAFQIRMEFNNTHKNC